MGYNENQTTSKPSTSATLEVDCEASAASSANTAKKLKEYDSTEFTTNANTREAEVGSGSFASVIRCFHALLGMVVLKCFRLTGSSDGINKRKLKTAVEEAQKLSVIDHPYIVKVHGITRWWNHCGIIMEEIKGGNLEDFLFDPKIIEIDWMLRLRLCLQIVEALHYLHSRSSESKIAAKPCMQHGDLKPQNILLTTSADVKLCDFSAAVVALATGINSSSYDFSCTRQYTPNYTAPEILLHQKCSIKSDVYSFGMIAFEIITRHRVFEGVNPLLVIELLSGLGIAPNEELVEQAGSSLKGRDLKIFLGLTDIMKKCWKIDAKERLSAPQVLEELRTLMTSLNIREKDLEYADIPKHFMKLARKRNKGTKINDEMDLDQLSVFPISRTPNVSKDEKVGEADSKEGAFLALKKGAKENKNGKVFKKGCTLIKYNVKSKKITHLQGKGDLNGVLVKSGADIYVVDCESEQQTIKKLVLSDNKWSSEVVHSKTGKKRSHAAIGVCENAIFIVGGTQEQTRDSGKRFDLCTKKWSRIRDMKYKRQGHVVVEAEDSEVLYVMGSFEMNYVESCDLYDEDGWKEIQPMDFERYGSAAVELNRKIYAIGGCDNRHNRLHSSVEVFDLQTRTWQQGPSLTKERCWHDACVIGRKIYVVGGETNIVESYDPVRNHGWEREIAHNDFKGVHSVVPL